MRFLYVDRSGRRVEVPTLEGLAARLELGAIAPDTMLYDSVADRWAPASEHEFFRSIVRPAGREGALPVTPPGVVPSPDEEVEPVVQRPAPPSDPPPLVDGSESTQEDPGDRIHPQGQFAGPEGEGLLSHNALFDLVDMGEGIGNREPRGVGPSAELELSVVPDEPPEPRITPRDPGEETGVPPREDLGDLEDLLIEGNSPGTPPRRPAGTEGVAGAEGDWRYIPGGPPPTPLRGPEATAVEEEEYWSPGRASSSTPLSGGGSGGGRGGRSGSRGRGGPSVSAVVAVLLGLVIIWFAVDRVTSRNQANVLPPELEVRLPGLSGAAFADMLTAMDSIADLRSLPDRPGQNWLEGVYLAGASRFQAEGAYWTLLQDVLSELRGVEGEVFASRLADRAEALALPQPQKELLVAEALRRFQESSASRDAVYDQAEAIARQASELHALLVLHEEEILYEPFTRGVSRDPVIEAVPTNRAVAEQMWNLIDGVTRGLQDIDAIMGVSTRSFLDAVFRGLRNAGWE
jgi:hypothetical protein